MPAVAATAREPTIGEIYAAFDPAAQRVFRAAMSYSRGGVVRVRDLLLALWHAAELPEELRRMAPVPSGEPGGRWLTPMSNEPALRELLQRSHRLAQMQSPSGGRGVISPLLMLLAAAEDAATASRELAALCRERGIAIPADRSPDDAEASAGAPAPTRDPRVRPPATPAVAAPEIDFESLLREVLTGWIALQSQPAGDDRQSQLAALAAQVRRWAG